MTLGAPLLRGVIGTLFVGHGTQKLFGWFDGPGLEGVKGMMEKLGLRPPERHAIAAGISETAGGTLLMLGALTPFATTALTATMVTAIRKVHAERGPFWALASLGAGIAGSYVATSPPVNEEPAGEPTGRFTRVEEPVTAQ